MFDLNKKTLTFHGRTLPIVKWVVYFSTPIGLITDLDEAIIACMSNDFDPNAVISPVSVALDSEDRYEVIVRH